MLHGRQEYFYENGQLKTLMHYQNGKICKSAILYWQNGKVKREVFFDKGSDKIYDKMGKLIDG